MALFLIFPWLFVISSTFQLAKDPRQIIRNWLSSVVSFFSLQTMRLIYEWLREIVVALPELFKSKNWAALLKTLAGTLKTLAALPIVFSIFGGLVWLGNKAYVATTWKWRIIYGLFPALAAAAMLGGVIYGTLMTLRPFVRDVTIWSRSRKLRHTRVSRPWIAQRYAEFHSGMGRAAFVAGLRTCKVDDSDWPAGPPYTDDSRAAAELARLDERWRGLDR